MKREVVVFCSWILEVEGESEAELVADARVKLTEFLQSEDAETVVNCGLDDVILDAG